MQTRSGRQVKKPDFYKPPDTFEEDEEEDEEDEEEDEDDEEEDDDCEDADENGNLKDFVVYSDDEDN